MSSYLLRGGSCWAGAGWTGKEGAHAHTPVRSDSYNGRRGHTSEAIHACAEAHTCRHLPSSRRDNPGDILVTAVTRVRGCLQHTAPDYVSRLISSSSATIMLDRQNKMSKLTINIRF